MSIQTLAFQLFNLSRRVAGATGVTRPVRALLGPTAGKLLYRLSANSDSPTLVQGHRIFLATKGKYPPIRMAMGKYEEETTQLFETCLKPGMTVLDIGAHVGYYSLLSARLVGPSGKVFSFEPDPDNYSLLVKNIEENGYKTITALNQGAAATSGFRPLYLSGLDNGRHSFYHQNLPQNGVVSISTTSIDEYLESLGWPEVDLVKVDVEGAELDVLRGMTGLLDHCQKIKLIMELNPALLKNAEIEPICLLREIESKGLVLHLIKADAEPVRLQEPELASLIDRLYSTGDSVNLYCSRQ